MKKLILICLCLILAACAHKPVASPEEVNQYSDTLCYQFKGVEEIRDV
jgi:starvation-inducible outer membrane lipoprotein